MPPLSPLKATNKVYACVVGRKDHLVRKEGGGFDSDEYEEFPERYASTFSIKVLWIYVSNRKCDCQCLEPKRLIVFMFASKLLQYLCALEVHEFSSAPGKLMMALIHSRFNYGGK